MARTAQNTQRFLQIVHVLILNGDLIREETDLFREDLQGFWACNKQINHAIKSCAPFWRRSYLRAISQAGIVSKDTSYMSIDDFERCVDYDLFAVLTANHLQDYGAPDSTTLRLASDCTYWYDCYSALFAGQKCNECDKRILFRNNNMKRCDLCGGFVGKECVKKKEKDSRTSAASWRFQDSCGGVWLSYYGKVASKTKESLCVGMFCLSKQLAMQKGWYGPIKATIGGADKPNVCSKCRKAGELTTANYTEKDSDKKHLHCCTNTKSWQTYTGAATGYVWTQARCASKMCDLCFLYSHGNHCADCHYNHDVKENQLQGKTARKDLKREVIRQSAPLLKDVMAEIKRKGLGDSQKLHAEVVERLEENQVGEAALKMQMRRKRKREEQEKGTTVAAAAGSSSAAVAFGQGGKKPKTTT
jgi:hypothetical protein